MDDQLINHTQSQPTILLQGEYTVSDVEDIKKTCWKYSDILESQLRELFEVDNPNLIDDEEEFKNRFEQYRKKYVGEDDSVAGNYVYYPWSGLLMHVIDAESQNRLRTNRMNNLLTLEEQNVLSDFSCGVAGLSFGNGIALSLVYSGAAQRIKIADRDIFETTNLNRVRVGLPSVGQQKTSVTAEEIYEINPYANLDVYADGLTSSNIEAFMTDGGNLGAIFDVVDDFPTKVRIRLAAKKFGIPVIMLTSLEDSVLVDVERYDLDQEIDIFHGLLGNITDALLNQHMTEAEKAKYAMAIVGKDHVSYRNLLSLSNVGKTLVSRPHLFGTVSIVCGLATYITKRIALGEAMPSMRRFIEFHKVLGVDANRGDTLEAREAVFKEIMGM